MGNSKLNKVDYNKSKKYWNKDLEQRGVNKYSSGYVLSAKFEQVAKYRFNKELKFLNKFGKFGGNYLDLGCGAGNYIKEWHDKFVHLIGIDFSDKLVKIAKIQLKKFKNVEIFEDTVLNFEKYTKNKKFRFIFVGGCFMYLNDRDVSKLVNRLIKKLDKEGVLIFREPIVTHKRIYEKGIGIRRTVNEYKELVNRSERNFTIGCYQNYAVSYTQFMSLYFMKFPFLFNKERYFNYSIIELLFLYLPLKLHTKLKKNKILYYYFVINPIG